MNASLNAWSLYSTTVIKYCSRLQIGQYQDPRFINREKETKLGMDLYVTLI